jgi:hypothetical protein
VVLLGINGIGYEASNSLMTNGRALPWLQDVASVDVWAQWAVEYRDVIIVDRAGVKRGAYNLTTHDLSVSTNFDELEAKLLDAR